MASLTRSLPRPTSRPAHLSLLAPLALLPLACSGDDSGSTESTSETSTSSSTTSDTETATTTATATTQSTTSSSSDTDGETTGSSGEPTSTTADTDTTTTTTDGTDTDTDTDTDTTGGFDPVIIEGFDHPESALYDGKEMYWYISNIGGDPSAKDGNGFISRLGPDGSVDAMEWATGFNGPKGLALAGTRLFVADIDQVHVVNTADGTIAMSTEIKGAAFLNDAAIDAEGSVYISDTGTNTIHILKQGESPAVFLQSEILNGVNGLAFAGDRLFVSSIGNMNDPGGFFEIVDGQVIPVGTLKGALDGVVTRMDNALVTDYSKASVFLVPYADGEPELLLDLGADYGFMSTADLGLARNLGRIAVPDLAGDKVGIFPL